MTKKISYYSQNGLYRLVTVEIHVYARLLRIGVYMKLKLLAGWKRLYVYKFEVLLLFNVRQKILQMSCARESSLFEFRVFILELC